MFTTLLALTLGAADPAGPIFDRTRPLVSDFDVSGTTIGVEVTHQPGYYEYVYTFHAAAENRGKGQHFLLNARCEKPMAAAEGFFPGRSAESFRSYSNTPYVPALLLWGEGAGESAEATVYPEGMMHFFVTLEPGMTDTLRIRSPGAPALRTYALQPNVEYYERIDWPESGHIEGLPGEQDFGVNGLIMAPGCTTQPSSATPRLPGTNVMREFEGINGVLTYAAPLRDRMHLENGATTVEMRVHYSPLLDPASFETCPASLRTHFNPVPGATETVRLPITEARAFVTLAARPQGPPPVQPEHAHATHSPIDVDVFEFRRNDLPYTPREIACRMYPEVPEALAVYPAPPPPKYDGRPLVWGMHAPEGEIVAVRGQSYPFSFLLSEQADPASLRLLVDGEDVTAGLDVSGPVHGIRLPPKLGERRIVVEVRARPEVVGAPKDAQRFERTLYFKGMEMRVEAKAISIDAEGVRTEKVIHLPPVEIDPGTGKPVESE